MVVNLKPETERLRELAATSGRAPEELVEDAMSGYLVELAQVRETLDRRYDEMKSGETAGVDGAKVIASLKRRNEHQRN